MNILDASEIKEEVEERKIKYLTHFTNCKNLSSIFKNGLLSREYLDNDELDYHINDLYRHDKKLDYVCTSITFPNYKMFYKLRKEKQNEAWAVLIIKADVLFTKDCIFCVTNAGECSEYSKSIQERTGIVNFSKLFYNDDGIRDTLGLDKNMPTNPQAEVLIKNGIEKDKIIGVVFPDKKTKSLYIGDIDINNSKPKVIVNHKYFNCRMDYKYWQ